MQMFLISFVHCKNCLNQKSISSFFELSHLMKKPHEVEYGSIKSHEFFVHSCVLVDPKTSCDLMDPENQQGSINSHEVLGPSKHMRF